MLISTGLMAVGCVVLASAHTPAQAQASTSAVFGWNPAAQQAARLGVQSLPRASLTWAAAHTFIEGAWPAGDSRASALAARGTDVNGEPSAANSAASHAASSKNPTPTESHAVESAERAESAAVAVLLKPAQ